MYDKRQAARMNLAKTVEELRLECRNHFDFEIAKQVCERNDLLRGNYGGRKWELVPKWYQFRILGDFLSLFAPGSEREFLAFYLEELREKVAGKANCGCANHAEQCIPCEHDLALLGPAVVPTPEKKFNCRQYH